MYKKGTFPFRGSSILAAHYAMINYRYIELVRIGNDEAESWLLLTVREGEVADAPA